MRSRAAKRVDGGAGRWRSEVVVAWQCGSLGVPHTSSALTDRAVCWRVLPAAGYLMGVPVTSYSVGIGQEHVEFAGGDRLLASLRQQSLERAHSLPGSIHLRSCSAFVQLQSMWAHTEAFSSTGHRYADGWRQADSPPAAALVP